jgi:hypothetical protein
MNTGAFFKFSRMLRLSELTSLDRQSIVLKTGAHVHAHLALKEAALAKTTPLNGKQARFRPPDELLKFLNDL